MSWERVVVLDVTVAKSATLFFLSACKDELASLCLQWFLWLRLNHSGTPLPPELSDIWGILAWFPPIPSTVHHLQQALKKV